MAIKSTDLQVYAVEHDTDHLLLVDGRWVINGNYEVIRHKDGSVGNKMNKIKAYPVGTVKRGGSFNYDRYNEVLNRFRSSLKK